MIKNLIFTFLNQFFGPSPVPFEASPGPVPAPGLSVAPGPIGGPVQFAEPLIHALPPAVAVAGPAFEVDHYDDVSFISFLLA